MGTVLSAGFASELALCGAFGNRTLEQKGVAAIEGVGGDEVRYLKTGMSGREWVGAHRWDA